MGTAASFRWQSRFLDTDTYDQPRRRSQRIRGTGGARGSEKSEECDESTGATTGTKTCPLLRRKPSLATLFEGDSRHD